ncbi:hypothetical protein BX616_006739 [Lobosporangium transversale]|nr:hypothetical protein BX616_006739 [Lobosporangium transversale]
MMPPPRSISFAGTSSRPVYSSVPFAKLPADINNSPPLFTTNTRKGQIVGNKTPKKGIKNRFRKLRRKQGSSSRDNGGVNAFITSGESDSEATFEPESDLISNVGGITHRFPSAPESKKASLSTRSKLKYTDSGLPPQLPPRNGPSSIITHFNNGQGPVTQGKGGSLSGSEQGHENNKAVRLLLKSVGFSNQHSTAPLSTAPSARDLHGTQNGVMKPIQTRSTFPLFGDFLSGDDQPSTSKGFKLKGSGRRKRRFTKKTHSVATGMFTPFATAATDDEDSSTSRSSRHRHHHGFLHSFHHRHRSRSVGEEVRHQIPVTWCLEALISPALKEARQANPDPNLLLVELEPLPTSFVNAFATLSASKTRFQSQTYQQQHHPYTQIQQGPLAPHVIPFSIYSTPIGTLTNYEPQSMPQQSRANGLDIIGTKSFLFRSYENSKFQGYYIFRVLGKNVEYKKLSLKLEPACAQYFREAYVTYRALEKKAKTLREEQEQSRIASFWPNDGGQDDTSEQLETGILSTALSKPTKESVRLSGSERDKQNLGEKIVKSALAWDQTRMTSSGTLSESPIASPVGISSGRALGYLDQRYSPISSSNLFLRGIAGTPDRSRSDPTEHHEPPFSVRQISNNNNNNLSKTIPYSAQLLSRKWSWTSVKEQQRLEQLQLQTAEIAKWKEMERKYREEFRQATFGLELYLGEIARGLEYEKFDTAVDVSIMNDNHATAIFSMLNGDRTNIMCLESPSVKLKCEFINWIAISVMDHGDVESDHTIDSSKPHGGIGFDAFMDSKKHQSENISEDMDLLIDMIDLRLAQQEGKLQASYANIQNVSQQIDMCLDKLNKLDDGAKKLMTAMLRAIDNQEIQLALRPSPSTGKTLAETVDAKLKDVNERIVLCTKIMGAARFNLNRLRDEIGLEQRSIRLLRKYKIIIAAFILIFFLWLLYYSPS